MGDAKWPAIVLSLLILALAIAPSNAAQEDEKTEEPMYDPMWHVAVLETDHGVIKFVLYENWTPIHTDNFMTLARGGHYDGVLFHRIIDDFMIQTGDGGGSSTIPLEPHPNATHVDGAVGMARGDDPDSASDQFYICDGPQHGLDDSSINSDEDDTGYTVFGLVIEGIEVVREIAETPVYGENRIYMGPLNGNLGKPKEDVYLNKVTIENGTANETAGIASLTSVEGGLSASCLLPVLIAIPVAAIAVLFLRKKKKKMV